ncbi:MAG: hypothetical protein QF752_17085 [Planctomycetota bacterium]|nr:hypothetical protein [Planctomycetota bacterium]
MNDPEPKNPSNEFRASANRNRVPWRRVILLGIFHGTVTLVLIGYSFGSSMENFEGNRSPEPLDRIVETLVEILVFPLSQLWNPWLSSNLPDALEWIAFLGNSLLWGAGLAWITSRRPKRPPEPERM